MTSVEDTTTVPVPLPDSNAVNDNHVAVTDSRLLGQVKWFNNKVGYGFITVNDGEFSGKDIFTHYSAIRVTNQYKYLVQGEYVEFTLVKSTTDTHEFQAVDISGIKGGSLMCETRRINRPPRDSGDASAQDSSYVPAQRPQRRYRTNGLGGNSDSRTVPAQAPAPSNEGGEFTSVRRRRPQQARGPRKQQNTSTTA